jgi:hypothetical protein
LSAWLLGLYEPYLSHPNLLASIGHLDVCVLKSSLSMLCRLLLPFPCLLVLQLPLVLLLLLELALLVLLLLLHVVARVRRLVLLLLLLELAPDFGGVVLLLLLHATVDKSASAWRLRLTQETDNLAWLVRCSTL